MTKIAFDPGALIEKPDGSELTEATLERTDAGRLVLCVIDDDGSWLASITLRPDFLDEVIRAGLVAREAAA